MTGDTKTGIIRAILCLILIAVIVCIGIVVFYTAVFHFAHEPFIEPTIDLTNMEKVYDSHVREGSNTYSINGSDYEIYCKLNLRNKNARR